MPQNSYLLNTAKIKHNKSIVPSSDLDKYIIQRPNSLMLGIMRFKLYSYSLSGKDSTKWLNRALKSFGEPPVILDTAMMTESCEAIQNRLHNKGYLNAKVSAMVKQKKRRSNVDYIIDCGDLYKIRKLSFDIPNDSAQQIISQQYDSTSLIHKQFDIELLNNLRNNLTFLFRKEGFFNVQKEMFVYHADTSNLHKEIDIKMMLQPEYTNDSSIINTIFTKKYVDSITIYCNDIEDEETTDTRTIDFDHISINYTNGKKIFVPRFLSEKVFVKTNTLYNEMTVERTANNFGYLEAIKNSTIKFVEKDNNRLNCTINISPADRYNYSVGIDGNTNSGATVGVAANAGFMDRNIFGGAEVFKVNGRIAYDLYRKADRNYNKAITIGLNSALTVPKLLFPYIKESFRFRHGATTHFSANYYYQKHPDFRRSIVNTVAGYQWQTKQSQYRVDLIDMSYIKVDSVSQTFLDNNPNLRPTFQDHLVLKTVISYATSNRRNKNDIRDYYSFRGKLSSGGNILYALNNVLALPKNEDGQYTVLKVPFAQFIKGEVECSYSTFLSSKLNIVWHSIFGIGIPYKNANVLPFEERFFAGGSNSMRGWDARSLGPGHFHAKDNYYLLQNGDIKLELNAEARLKLFWVLEGAFFVDAGNIWTIKQYSEQKGGEYSLATNKMFDEIALNYGVGLRFNFDFFLIRFDLGIKLYDPRYENPQQRWAISKDYGGGKANRIDHFLSPQFAIGYPF